MIHRNEIEEIKNNEVFNMITIYNDLNDTFISCVFQIAENSDLADVKVTVETATNSAELSNIDLENDDDKDQFDDDDFTELIDDNSEGNLNDRICDHITEDLASNTFKEEVMQVAIKSKTEEVIEKTDGLSCHFQNDIIIDTVEISAPKNIIETDLNDSIKAAIEEDTPVIANPVKEVIDDSDDDSDMTESEDEFMPDGERIRKTSRGFKQISNCKRFWRASMLTG